ncbi:unnamed protein product, partial [Effrenium voratum]
AQAKAMPHASADVASEWLSALSRWEAAGAERNAHFSYHTLSMAGDLPLAVLADDVAGPAPGSCMFWSVNQQKLLRQVLALNEGIVLCCDFTYK